MFQKLLTDGIVFESIPSSLSLPGESGPHPVNLAGIPKEVGELHILGKFGHCFWLSFEMIYNPLVLENTF